MPAESKRLMDALDPELESLILELQERAWGRPDAPGLRLALEAILNRLVETVPLEGGDKRERRQSIELLMKLRALFPENPTPSLLLSKVCIDSGDFEAGLEHASAGLGITPDDPGLVFNHAFCLLNMGRHEEAIEGFRRYLELQPYDPWAYNNIGDAYRSAGLYDQAEAYFKRAIRCDREFIPAYVNLALLYQDQRDWQSCLANGLIAERYGPPDKDVKLAVAEAFLSRDEPRAALSRLVDATLIDKDFVPAYESMAAAYFDLGMHELAVAAAQEALKRDPTSWMALANIGYALAHQGRFEEAVDYQLRALDCAPDEEGRYRLLWELGWNCFELDRLPEAKRYTEEAMRLKEFPNVMLSFNLALMLLAEGKIVEAEKAYREAAKRAEATDQPISIVEAKVELVEYLRRKGLRLEPGSWLRQWIEKPVLVKP